MNLDSSISIRAADQDPIDLLLSCNRVPMGKRQEKKPGHGKLLDAWTAPPGAGDPVGCLATTFTFHSEFFEEQCLSRFARIESDRDEDGPVYLLEMEEKLSQLACAAVLVDQHHCKGSRSPRWDLLGVRTPAGILHAKIALLHWARHLRLIVASANLTEDGYRRNREVFGVLDYDEGSEAPAECVHEIVAFLQEIVSETGGERESPPAKRCRQFLSNVLSAVKLWATPAPPSRSRVEIRTILIGPGRSSALDAIAGVWPVGRPQTADIVSPFFDPPAAANQPVPALWQLLRQRREAEVRFHVTAEDVPISGEVLLHAPQSLRDAAPSACQAATTFHRLPDEPLRPLHAKAIWLENDLWAGYLIGSSNFTSAGLGVAAKPNREANLFYLMHRVRNAVDYHAASPAFPESEPIPTDAELRWQPLDNEDESGDASVTLLPRAFAAAIFACDAEGRFILRLSFLETPPAGWRLDVNETDETLLTESEWAARGSPLKTEIDWPAGSPAPYGLTVWWDGSGGSAWWPVNIESGSALPPPDELRGLPLEVLIDVLTSGRPLHKVMQAWLNRRKKRDGVAEGIDLDPHKRVDTTAFLLQRTRRVSWLLKALRERLERPLATRESLMWRLEGPVGVQAVARALVEEADRRNSADERCFLLSELALELTRVRLNTNSAAVSAKEAKHALHAAIHRIVAQIDPDSIPADTSLRRYVDRVIQEIGGVE